MNYKISIELSREEWELIVVSLKYKKMVTVTERGREQEDRLIQKISGRLREARTPEEQ